ncbi:TetR/AcrR family transcriptional regulator C-terminal domain-containing protein [Plantactinospora solaniradicis]|uniref:TetR/AcrR family transcriptional regulator C-terminal domain-containing protein n=1 Tax=Plantactinospora solaniradicis TaxID=1723736 RepID=A0ABW1KBY2_9ACTN
MDEIYGELAVAELSDPGGWRAVVGGSAHDLRSMALRHPWVVSVLGQIGLATLGPNLTRWSEGLLAAFETAGFALDEADQAMNTLAAYVIGVATSEAAYLSMLARSGQSERDWIESLRPVAEQSVQEHPLLSAGYVARRDRDPREIRDDNFEYGLQRVLDGPAVRLGPAG